MILQRKPLRVQTYLIWYRPNGKPLIVVGYSVYVKRAFSIQS